MQPFRGVMYRTEPEVPLQYRALKSWMHLLKACARKPDSLRCAFAHDWRFAVSLYVIDMNTSGWLSQQRVCFGPPRGSEDLFRADSMSSGMSLMQKIGALIMVGTGLSLILYRRAFRVKDITSKLAVFHNVLFFPDAEIPCRSFLLTPKVGHVAHIAC